MFFFCPLPNFVFLLTDKLPLHYMTENIPDMSMKLTYEYLTYDNMYKLEISFMQTFNHPLKH